MKYSVRLVDINVSHASATRSLLQEILRMKSKCFILIDRCSGGSNKFGQTQKGQPIIVVPGHPSQGNLCLQNAVQFLRDGKFVPFEQLTEEQKTNPEINFTHKIGGEEVSFEVHDSVTTFKIDQEWKRVVAIFTVGQAFQLKEWPPHEALNFTEKERHLKLVNLFHRVRGFFLYFQELPPPPTISQWNVKKFALSRNKRYTDMSIKNQVWKELEAFVNKERFKDAGF